MKVVLNIDSIQLIKVKNLVYKMKITIYGRENCSWCSKANNIVDELSKIASTQIKTVPIILLDGNYIGGYTELEENFK